MTERVLILGATGMLGYTLFMHSLSRQDLDTYAAVRDSASLTNWFPAHALGKIIQKVDAYNNDSITRAVAISQPDIIINCIGLVKQTPLASDPLAAIPINALLPHRLAMICKATGARLIHISTDCVFSGSKGNYSENDDSDANDLYGRTKYLGEVSYLPHCVTLRTSIIGHELKGKIGLLEWFLSQNEKIKGYTKAIFSGFPTIELAQIILERVLPNPHLAGVYHVSSQPIAKYDLLRLVSEKYAKKIEIERYDDFCEDRSLDSSLFRRLTGYSPPLWPVLIDKMHNHYISTFEIFRHGEK
jgi:dTDP-4-dehydrorhamnose reductase